MITVCYIQIIISYISFALLTLYYAILGKGLSDTMTPPAIILLIFAVVNLFVGIHLLDKNKKKDRALTQGEKLLKLIVYFPLYALLLPFFLIFVLISIPYDALNGTYTVSKPLRKKGFKYTKKRRPYREYLTRGDTVILFGFEEYKISFDGGESFTDIICSEIGTEVERAYLSEKLCEYIDAPDISKQRLEIKSPRNEFIHLLDKYLH